LVAQSQCAAEIGGPWFLCNEGIGACFDDTSVDVLGAEDAAEPRGRLVENILDGGVRVPAKLFEFEGCGKAGNASADNGDASQNFLPQRLKPF